MTDTAEHRAVAWDLPPRPPGRRKARSGTRYQGRLPHIETTRSRVVNQLEGVQG